MQQQAHGNEHQVVGVQVQRRQRSLRRAAEEVKQVPAQARCHQDRQQRAVFQPFARAWSAAPTAELRRLALDP